MSLTIPSKKRRRRGGYKSFLTSKKDDSQRQQQSKPYKAYLTGSDEQVPRSTTRRWTSHDTQMEDVESGPSQVQQEHVFPSSPDEENSGPLTDESDRDTASEQQVCSLEDLSSTSDDYDSDLISEQGSDISLQSSSSRSSSPLLAAGDNTFQTLPLFEDSKIDLSTAIGSILDFYISNNLSKQGLQDLLKLLDSMLPSPNTLPKSKYQLDQFIWKNSPTTKYVKHYFCTSCHCYIGAELNNLSDECPICHSVDDKSCF